jgi:hypothetical protein
MNGWGDAGAGGAYGSAMAEPPERPLLFLDVDGPLIPFGIGAYPGVGERGRAAESSNPLLARLNPGLGPLLQELPCELVWATAWMDDANEEVSPRLGLPGLPVVAWPDADDPADEGLHWKTRTLVTWAAGRAFVWVDDEIGAADRAWVAVHHPGPALLHHVDAARGLAEEDFGVIKDWLLTRVGAPDEGR